MTIRAKAADTSSPNPPHKQLPASFAHHIRKTHTNLLLYLQEYIHIYHYKMTRGIQLSTLSGATSTTGKYKHGRGLDSGNTMNINGSNEGWKMENDDERMTKRKGGASLVGGLKKGQVEDEVAASSPRSVRYSARSARKSSVHVLQQSAVASSSPRRRGSVASLSSDTLIASTPASTPSRKCNLLLSPISYSALVTISIVVLAWTMVQPVQAALACQVRRLTSPCLNMQS